MNNGEFAFRRDLKENRSLLVGAAIHSGPVEVAVGRLHQAAERVGSVFAAGKNAEAVKHGELASRSDFERDTLGNDG